MISLHMNAVSHGAAPLKWLMVAFVLHLLLFLVSEFLLIILNIAMSESVDKTEEREV